MRTLICSLALAMGCGLSTQAAAVGRLVDLSVYDCTTQQNLPVYQHGGRYYVAGQPGHRYQIHINNRQDDRVLACCRSMASMSFPAIQSMCRKAVMCWMRVKAPIFVAGQVVGFVFASFEQSYATQTGRPDNVGVIGLAVFRSATPPSVVYEERFQEKESDARSNKFTGCSPNLPWATDHELRQTPAARSGTGHGMRENSTVSYTGFERVSSLPDEVITLYYDTREHLIAKGVITAPRRVRQGMPDPFPSGRFVPDP